MFSTEGSDWPSCATDLYIKLSSFLAAFPNVLVCLQFALTTSIASTTVVLSAVFLSQYDSI